VPRDGPADQHRHRPAGGHRGGHIGQAVPLAMKQPPAISDAESCAVHVQRMHHAHRRGAQPARPDPVQFGVHASLLVGEPGMTGRGDGMGSRFEKRGAVFRVQ
jgi:hypothetical protein